jgi:hypothetical protein
MTTQENKVIILADLWLNYRDDSEFTDFVEYNDLGLPLSYMIANGIVERNEIADQFVSETFDLLLAGLAVEDEDFETLEDILGIEEFGL